jgi:uncharacterized protein YkwD
MLRKVRFGLLVPVVCLTLGGCPLIGNTDGSSTNGGTEPAGTSGAGNGDGTAAPPSSADTLTVVFPDCTEPDQASSWRAEILLLVNQERVANGLVTVTQNPTLEEQATYYACEMIHYDFFDHVNPATGTTLGERADQFGYDYLVIGENLAAGQTSPEAAMADWMASPGHRDNILDPRFTELGVGVRTGGEYGVYWVQEFGLPNSTRKSP